MADYTVTWEIDIDGHSFYDAAECARKIQLDPSNIATFYTVENVDTGETRVVNIPVEEDDHG